MSEEKPKTVVKSKKIACYIDRLPPCNNACPAGENIQAWLQLVKAGKFKEAFEKILENNPMPAIHGRVCYHNCETKCNRAQFDSTVSNHNIERFLGDMALKEGWTVAPGAATGKKILIVGAGPAGLSCAYHLRRFGHEVTIYEALPKAGGMMLVGIPAYRLARDILDGEVQRILNLGVNISYNHKVDDLLAEKEAGKFDAVFLAVGAHIGKNVLFPVKDPCRIWDAVDYLREASINTPPKTGSRLVVYGGGNTAIDVARTAIRLGVKDVSIVYHRTRQKMPAFALEVEEALEEGVKLHFLRTIVSLEANTLTLSVNELDEKGAPKPTGQTETFDTDAVVLALSQIPDTEFLSKVPNIEVNANATINVDEDLMTGSFGIFAGGDMIPFDRSVTHAVGHGKFAARKIDAFLAGKHYTRPLKHEAATFDKLHITTTEKTPKVEAEVLPAGLRIKDFSEGLKTISKEDAVYESKRCFSCGNCFECDGCYAICPVHAITKLGVGKRYLIDTDKCIGCGKCFKRCPCGAIVMIDRK
ncbi:MAG: NAD(P)-binding protein [Gammaproteobacteria bacterium]|nr:NAD(P)-binding protein [Gammaproteobacteria bacterium]